MRILVAAACVAIIAFVGFYFWDRSSSALADRLISECADLREQTTTDAEYFEKPYDQSLVDRCFEYYSENPVDGAL